MFWACAATAMPMPASRPNRTLLMDFMCVSEG
jgi:hypothetical protein